MTLTAGQLFVSTGRGSEVTAVNPEDLYNSFTYTLTAPALTTSAAVYDANGILQRTLWTALTGTAGTHRGYWAGDMDDGTPATGTPPFYARVIAHNVQYVWEGVIGNLSSSFTGSGVTTTLVGVTTGVVIAGSDLWVSNGYNEQQQALHKFALSDPNTRTGGMLQEIAVSPNNIATDGTNLYWATGGAYGNTKSFIAAHKLSDSTNVSFSSGTPISGYSAVYSAIDVYDTNPAVSISIASPAVVTVSNNFVAGAKVIFSTTGALPTGITAGTTYYVIAAGLSSSSFEFSATLGGAAVNTSGSQSGEQRISTPGVTANGISVSASYIAASHPALAAVHVLNKTTGALVNTISVASLLDNTISYNQIAFDPSGNLWVIDGTSVVEYTNPGVDSTTGTTIAGFTHPIAVATDSSGNVWVADGDDVQQVFKYDSTGTLLATFGAAGGYMTDANVSASKFWFYWPDATWNQSTALCPDGSGGIWVADTGNMRILHFTSGGTNDATMMWSGAVYNVTVDHNNPSRVFMGYLEFAVDYTQTLAAGATAAWTLARNWTAGGPAGPMATVRNHYHGFYAVETLSNGHTYAHIGRSSGSITDIFEIPTSGLARNCSSIAAPAGGDYGKTLYENGDLRYASIPAVGYGNTETFYVQSLTGFDGSNNPTWGAAVSKGTVLSTATSPWFRGGGFALAFREVPITSSNTIVLFDGTTNTSGSSGNEGFHLGGLPVGGTSYSWQASYTGFLNNKGAFQTHAVDHTVQYGGNQVWTYGRHIIYGYHGEFYTDRTYSQTGQANQFMHYYDDGLFIGQFGVPNIAHYNPGGTHPAGCAGNSFSNTYAYANGNLYWYHGDESVHGGIHRWRIDGIDTISEQDFALRAFP